ncbi:MAG TPA: AAA family ATPase [Pyrinomonadaceae bacterium]|jgi:Cdc6-like AAA superfamily ATPase
MTHINTQIVETNMMREIIDRTLNLHLHGGGGALWYGKSGIGKTATARHLAEKVNQHAASVDPSAFRVVHYHIGEISASSGNATKQAIKSLYEAALGRAIDTGLYRRSLSEDLAIMLVRELRANKIEMIFIDGADVLAQSAIRAMMFVIKIAEDMGWGLSLIFIGNDPLPLSIQKVPPLFRRIFDWCYFEEYGLEETWEILAGLHPHFGSLDPYNAEHVSQIKFIHELIGGYPGPLVRFIQLMDYYSKHNQGTIDERFLRVVYHLSQQNREKALEDSKNGGEKPLKLKGRRRSLVSASAKN